MSKLLIIDGNSLFNRAFYSNPLSMTNSVGVPTNAVYGFTNMLIKALNDIQPTELVVVFDVKAPTFRHAMFADYKGTRKGMPDELRVQVPMIKDMLRAMKITCIELAGYEADDIAGTIASRGYPTVILTGDNDYLQLVSDTTTVCITKKGISDLDVKTPQTLMDSHGLTPSQIIELKALMGDSSDNIPGVTGIGPKTASTLIQKYGSIEGVYDNIDNLKGKQKENLENDKDMAFLSRDLARIDVNVPINVDIKDMNIVFPFSSEVYEMFQSFGFKSLILRSELFVSDVSESIKPKHVATNIVIKTMDELKKAIDVCLTYDQVAIDLGNYTFAVKDNEGYSIELGGDDLFSLGLDVSQVLDEMGRLFESQIDKVVYNQKSMSKMLLKRGCKLNNVKHDLMLLKYVVDFEPNINSLKSLVESCNLEGINTSCAMLIILPQLLEKLENGGFSALYYDIELPLSDVLLMMEVEGFKMNKSVLEEIGTSLDEKIKELTQNIYGQSGEEFNINSPKQLGEILFEKLGLKSTKKSKRGYATDAETLEKLSSQHPIIDFVLEYRQMAKLRSTYVEGLLTQIESDGKIHTEFNQALTTTGRLSSKEPNLQNIPIRTKMGRELRRPFIPSSDDRIIVSADYSQIELRLLAHFSGDPILTEAYINGDDIHAITASQVFGIPLNEVTSENRRRAKAVNFGIIYGISDFGLAKQIGVFKKEAKEYMDKYFEKYPNVQKYMANNVEFCREHGYVEAITGRRRYIKEIKSSNYMTRSFGERASMNMPLQGSAADIIKIAMINVFKELEKRGLKSKLILQVHDELIIDCLKSETDEVISILKEQMEGAVKLNVPLPVNVAMGDSWYDAK